MPLSGEKLLEFAMKNREIESFENNFYVSYQSFHKIIYVICI